MTMVATNDDEDGVDHADDHEDEDDEMKYDPILAGNPWCRGVSGGARGD